MLGQFKSAFSILLAVALSSFAFAAESDTAAILLLGKSDKELESKFKENFKDLSCFESTDQSAINEKITNSKFEIAIVIKEDSADFYFPPTFKPTTLWNISFPYRPGMETLSNYSVQLSPEKAAILPLLLENDQINVPTEDQIFSALKLFKENEYPFLERIALGGKSFCSASAKITILNYLAAQENPSADGWFYYNLANLKHSQERMNYLIKGEALFQQNNDGKGSALCRLEMARNEVAFEKNLKHYDKVLEYAVAQKDSITQAKVLMALGEMAQQQGQLTAAELFLEGSADLHERGGDLYQATVLYTDLGIVKRKIGKPIDAVQVLEKALVLAERMQSEVNIVRVHYELGVTEAGRGQIDRALHHYHTAADFMEIMGDTVGLAKVDNKLGTLYLNQKDTVNAQLRYESALRIYTSLNDSSGMLQSYFNLGELTAEQGRYDIAENHFLKALQIARYLDNERLVASVLYSKGIARIKQGKYAAGYGDVKEAFDLSNGAVYGTPEESRLFLVKLEELIKDESEISAKKRAIQSGQ